MPACWLKPTAQLPVHPMACRNLAANNRVQHHCDPGGQKCTGSPGPLRGPFLQLLQNGTEVKSGTRNDYTGFCSVSSQCLGPFYPILVCADVTNTAPWIDHLAVCLLQTSLTFQWAIFWVSRSLGVQPCIPIKASSLKIHLFSITKHYKLYIYHVLFHQTMFINGETSH